MTLQEQIELITGPQSASGDWFDTTLLNKAKQHGEACPATPPADTEAVTINSGGQGATYNNHLYYDLAKSLRVAYERTADPTFLTLFRKCADSWWQHPTWIGSGTIRLLPDSATPSPREANLGGLILRAIDGRDDMWDWGNQYTRYSFNNWIKIRQSNPQLHYGVREGAFSLLYATWLAVVLPDSFPLQAGGMITNGAQLRADYLQDVETACVQYFGRLQYPDGSWRWSSAADEFLSDDGGTLEGIMQPFMVGLLLRALCVVHSVTTNPTVKENVKGQILRACRHLYSDGPYIKDQVEQNSGKRIRGFHYFFHGGTSKNPTRYDTGDIKFPWTATEAWWLPGARQAISTILGSFGYAYKISGDEFFKSAGDEMYDSAYLGTDGVRAMMDDTSKNFSQHVMGSSSYKAWVGGTVTQPPVPTPSPSPLPPSPDGTKATTIIDSTSAKWTLVANKTLRNGIQAGGGEGTIYKYLAQVVYVLGMDNFWYKWATSAWERLTQTEPGTTPSPTPTPTPTPAPTPTPTPVPPPTPIPAPALPRVLRYPTGLNEQVTLWQQQAGEGYRPNRLVPRPANQPKGNYVEFVKF